ncbi:PTS sugar transporter subunit IIA [Enterococcus sp. 669A]|uniref:PTS sugar transporter subunit IIA n=1 Tax=Candidatus Enterococcus moelleringii TaxID=2815325 RepID=A0ABS3L9H8_9ENTE|nr:PTS sugar transporter subunit IIA [Enterococcus sp. 669A]MBO1306279.1 PTS sugar transporter subunit IIA [Enterococcus sp. 669A]
MIGIIVVTHGDFGQAMIKSAEMIVGEVKDVKTCSLRRDSKADEFNQMLKKNVETFDHCEGIIIFSDLFGGTPSNISMLFNKDVKVRTITGLNMPMLVTCLMEREMLELDDLVEEVMKQGQEGIKNTTELVKERRKN